MRNYFVKFLAAYDYKSGDDFFLSLFPSFKYELQWLMLTISFVAGAINFVFGVTPWIAGAMVIAIIVEIKTGIKASKIKGGKFESFKFSRCWIKIAIWLTILYIINAFEKDYANRTNIIDIVAHSFFKFAFVATLTGFVVEYVTSILENLSVIQGKPKTELIEAITGGWKNLISIIKPKKQDEN